MEGERRYSIPRVKIVAPQIYSQGIIDDTLNKVFQVLIELSPRFAGQIEDHSTVTITYQLGNHRFETTLSGLPAEFVALFNERLRQVFEAL